VTSNCDTVSPLLGEYSLSIPLLVPSDLIIDLVRSSLTTSCFGSTYPSPVPMFRGIVFLVGLVLNGENFLSAGSLNSFKFAKTTGFSVLFILFSLSINTGARFFNPDYL